jgi:hypothetical protein
MSPIGLGLDVLLIGLLLVALTLGLRLNKRLKALREGQAAFVHAVGELDAAASRAESGLKALRAASEDTHDALLTRIETARGLIAKLENATFAAERASAVIPAATATAVPAPAPAPAALSRPVRPAAPRPVVRGIDEELFEEAPQRAGGLRR